MDYPILLSVCVCCGNMPSGTSEKEQRKNNRIIRPSADYTGPNNKDFVSIENR